MNNIIEVSNLCKHFEKFTLKDVTFTLPRGFVMGFIGPNGAGKTTTIKSLLGMMKPDSGNIQLLGQHDLNAIKDKIGIVMDYPFYVGEWTLDTVENVVSGFYSNWEHETYAKLLKKFYLDPTKKVADLSRGMQMKLMIAVALSHNADLLILDEPTSGLDPVARDELMDILREFIADENKGVLFSTHITSDLEKIADYISFIRNGQLVFTGTKDALLESYRIVKGGSGELSSTQKEHLMGLREHSAGFDGLALAEDLAMFSTDTVKDYATLDDIVVYMTREGRYDE